MREPLLSNKAIRSSFIQFCSVFLLVSCGGGGGDDVPANIAPTATNVSIVDDNGGEAEIGDSLTGTYTYNDIEGDVEGATNFRWLRNGEVVNGATASTYTFVAIDRGMNITFEVTPVASAGQAQGRAAISSNAITIYDNAPTASGVIISDDNGGMAEIGDQLTGSYTYDDIEGDVEGVSSFRWLRNGVVISGATASTYTLVLADAEADIVFEVTPVASTGAEFGNAFSSSVVAAGAAIEVLFPTSGSDVGRGYATTTTVMCKFNFAVSSAVANGVALSETSTGSGVWFAKINTNAGENTLNIKANIAGQVDSYSIQSTFNNNGAMRSPRGLAVDAANNRLYVIDGAHDSLLSVDLTTGLREVISDGQIGTGDTVNWPRKVKLHDSNKKLLVADNWTRTIVDIDLATGNRSKIGYRAAGSALGIELYPANNQVLVATSSYDAIYGFDLGTSLKSVVADSVTGTGGDLGWPYDIESDSAYSQYVVASQRPNALFRFEPSTGDRTVLASSTIGAGAALGTPNAVTWQPGDAAIWVGDSYGILNVDMSTGVRTRLLSTDAVYDLALDAANDRLLFIGTTAFEGKPTISAMNNADNVVSQFSNGAVGEGENFIYPRSLTYDASGEYIYVGDSSVIYKIELATGNRTIISSSNSDTLTGTGQRLSSVYSISIDLVNNQLYILNLNALIRVDLTTGDRTVVSNASIGSGTAFTKAPSLTIDLDSKIAWFVDYGINAVFQVDLITGDRTILSDVTYGTGPTLVEPFGIVKDTVNNRLIVADGSSLVAVNIDTGDRSVLSNDVNNGPLMRGVREISLDASRNRALVITNSASNSTPEILAVDLTTGDRTAVSQPGILGTGPGFRGGYGIAVDWDNNRVFVVEGGDGTSALYNVSLQTGDRVILSQ